MDESAFVIGSSDTFLEYDFEQKLLRVKKKSFIRS